MGDDDATRGALASHPGDDVEGHNLPACASSMELHPPTGAMALVATAPSGMPAMSEGEEGGARPGAASTASLHRGAREAKTSPTSRFSAVVNETASRARAQVEDGREEHWAHIMKKLAPQGYQTSPLWQKRILERVQKRMTTRGHEVQAKPLTEKQSMSAVDLALSALSPDSLWPLKTSTLPQQKQPGPARSPTAVQASLRKRILQRQNKVHFYTRGIQMEQLLSQDLDTDLRHMQQEVELTLRESRGGRARADDDLVRVTRKEKAVANRLQVLVEKTNALEAANAQLIEGINDLRSERALVLAQVKRMQEKDAKMDDDMAFLSQAAHSALDQREKVKVKLLQTQRDSALEKSHKLSQLAELMNKADSLDSSYSNTLAAIDEAEQDKKRRAYALGKQRRLADLQAKTRAGFLQSQVVGWDSEFARLQEFTGMDKRFAPGDDQTIEEITSRYLSKDQQNTSLLRYLHAQQVDIQSLETEIKASQDQAKALERQLQHAIESDSAPVMDYDGLAQKEAEAAYRIEAQLAELCEKTASITDVVASRSDSSPPPACTVATLEEHLQVHEEVVAKLHADWRRRYLQTRVRTQDVLWEWVQLRPAKAFETIDEIHERLVITATNAVQLGADDDEEEHERRAEKAAHFTPFARRRVNKAKERAQIEEWARRRKPVAGQGALTYVGAAAVPAPPAPVRTDPPPPLAAPASGSADGGQRKPTSAPQQGLPRAAPAPAAAGASAGAEGTMVYVIGGQ